MQNSALAVVLSRHFPHPDLTALPGALSATCHSVIGSILASVWRRSRPDDGYINNFNANSNALDRVDKS